MGRAELRVLAVLLGAAVGCDHAPATDLVAFEESAREPADAPLGWTIIPLRARPAPGALLEARLAALAAALEGRGGSRQPPVPLETTVLRRSLERIVSRVETQSRVSVHVRDLRTGEVLFDYAGDSALNPASNSKLLTAAAVLEFLGPDYRFQTTVAREGSTLYIVGSGDPRVMPETLAMILDRLDDGTDVTTIDRIVVDDHVFSARTLPSGYPIDGSGEGYEAPSGALSFNFNAVNVTVAGNPPRVRVRPESTHVQVVSTATRAAGRERPEIVSVASGEHTVIRVTGRLGRGTGVVTVRRRVADPALFTGGALAALIARETGRPPPRVSRGRMAAAAPTLHVHESDPLSVLVKDNLAYSNNVMAEQLLRTLAWRLTGVPGDWEQGNEILRRYWAAIGHDSESIRIDNASGLGEGGRLTAAGLVDLVAVARRQVRTGASLSDVLPVAGVEGTVKSRLRFSGKRVRAKTGTLRNVRALTGVVTAEDGTPQIAFSVLVNARSDGGRLDVPTAALDSIIVTLLRHIDRREARRVLRPSRRRSPPVSRGSASD